MQASSTNSILQWQRKNSAAGRGNARRVFNATPASAVQNRRACPRRPLRVLAYRPRITPVEKELAVRTLWAAADRSVSPADVFGTIRFLETHTTPAERDISPDVLNGQWRLQVMSAQKSQKNILSHFHPPKILVLAPILISDAVAPALLCDANARSSRRRTRGGKRGRTAPPGGPLVRGSSASTPGRRTRGSRPRSTSATARTPSGRWLCISKGRASGTKVRRRRRELQYGCCCCGDASRRRPPSPVAHHCPKMRHVCCSCSASAWPPGSLPSFVFAAACCAAAEMKVLDFVFRTMTVQLGPFRLPSLRLPPWFGPGSRASARDQLLGREAAGRGISNNHRAGKPKSTRTPGVLVEAPPPAAAALSSPLSSSQQQQEQSTSGGHDGGSAQQQQRREGGGGGVSSGAQEDEEGEVAEEVVPLRNVVATTRGMQARASGGHGWFEPSLSKQPAPPADDGEDNEQRRRSSNNSDVQHYSQHEQQERPQPQQSAATAAPLMQPLEEEEQGEPRLEPPWHDGPYGSALAHQPLREPPLGEEAQDASLRLRSLDEEEAELLEEGEDFSGSPEDEPSLEAVSSVTSGAAGMRGVVALTGTGKPARRGTHRRPSAPIAAAAEGAAAASSGSDGDGDGVGDEGGGPSGHGAAGSSGGGGGIPLHRRGRKRNAFFRIIYADDKVLVARGREGGVALWTRHSFVPAYKLA